MKNKKMRITIFRRVTVTIISALFFLSYYFDIQILEGSLIASRFIGLHLIDPFVTLEVFLASSYLPTNLLIGTLSIVVLYLIVGGRVFCSWVCPYGLISEINEKIHMFLVNKHIIKGNVVIPFGRYWFLFLWIALAITTGYLFFEVVNIMAITSKTTIYGFTLTSAVILPVIFLEIFISRRVWCRIICPVGTVYGLLNKLSAGKIAWLGECNKCGNCVKICYDKDILSFVYEGKKADVKPYYIRDTGCTLCAECIDVCPNKCLTYVNRLKNIV